MVIDDQQSSPRRPMQAGPFDYLALGDSYTIGVGVSEADRWPVQLASTLRREGISISDPKIIAASGWTTAELKDAILAEEIDETFDLVSLLIGVNNQYRGYDMAVYTKEFQELLQQAISLAHGKPGRVLVMSIPDYGVTEYADLLGLNPEKISRELEAYNKIAKEISEKQGVTFYDITPLSRMAADDLELTASDGLHPSGEMYNRWVQTCYQGVVSQLTKE